MRDRFEGKAAIAKDDAAVFRGDTSLRVAANKREAREGEVTS